LGLVTTRPRDLPLAGRPTSLRWTKRRWACGNTDCPRRSFTESLPTIPSRSRLTSRLRASAGAVVADGGRTVIRAARDHEISWPVTQAAFAVAAEAALPKQVPAVEHLGIDETRRGKAKFRLVPGPDGGEVYVLDSNVFGEMGPEMPFGTQVRMLSRMLFSALVKRPPFGRGQVIPIRVATNSAGKPITVGRLPVAIAIAAP
jgi:hypothetical protein